MLLFFLTLFSNYDLFNCNQDRQPKFNDTPLTALMHKTIHEIDTLLRDFQQGIHKEKLWLGNDSNEKGEDLKLVKPYLWHGNDTAEKNTTDVSQWWHGTYGNDTAASTNNLLTELNSLSPHTAPSSKERTTISFASVHPPILPADRSSDKPITISKYFKMLSDTNTKVDKLRTSDTPALKRVKGNRITTKPRPLARTISKAKAWVQSRRWTTTLTPGSSTSASSSATARALRTMTGMTLSTQTAYTEKLLHEDERGFLYVSTPESLYTITSTPSTVAGDVLFGADLFTPEKMTIYDPNKSFHDIMNATDEGYVLVFISELAKVVALKEERDMQNVIGHAEPIVNRLLEENKLGFAGRQIEAAATRLSLMMTRAYFDAGPLKQNAAFLHYLLSERETTLSSEVNALIDYTDMMFDDDQGEPLFNALRDFEEFPNTTNTAYQVCYNLLDKFIEPFRVLPESERGQALLVNLNKALLDRFGQRKVGYRRLGGELTGATPKLDLSRLKKRYTPSLKRRISKKRRELNRTRNQRTDDIIRRQYYYQTPWIPIIRSMLPITRHQKRFSVITPRQLWTNGNSNERRTREYRRRLSRPNHPPNDMRQFFPRVQIEKKRGKPLKQSLNHRRPRRQKDMLFSRLSKTLEQK